MASFFRAPRSKSTNMTVVSVLQPGNDQDQRVEKHWLHVMPRRIGAAPGRAGALAGGEFEPPGFKDCGHGPCMLRGGCPRRPTVQ